MSCYPSPCNPLNIPCTPPPVVVNFGGAPGQANWRLNLTSFEGGLSTSLDMLAISAFNVGSLVYMQFGGPSNPVNVVQKTASTAAPVPASIVRPPDYDATTNPYQWYVIG